MHPAGEKFVGTYVSKENLQINPFIPVSAKTATSQVDLQLWQG